MFRQALFLSCLMLDIIVGYMYPVYKSMEFLRTCKYDRKSARYSEYTHSIVYWLLYIIIWNLNYALWWLPDFMTSFLYFLKVFLLIILVHPNIKGAGWLCWELISDPLRSKKMYERIQKYRKKARIRINYLTDNLGAWLNSPILFRGGKKGKVEMEETKKIAGIIKWHPSPGTVQTPNSSNSVKKVQ